MDVTIQTAPEPERDENQDGAASSNSSPSLDSKPIMSTQSGGESSAPLGTPPERLQMLQMETRNSALAGLLLKYDFLIVNGASTLVLVVPNVSECRACKWWRLDSVCNNQRCVRYGLSTDKETANVEQ